MIISRRPPRSTNTGSNVVACFLCQWRSFRTSYRALAEKTATAKPSPSPSPSQGHSESTSSSSTKTPKSSTTLPPPSPLADAPRAYGKGHSDFTPKPLNRPIGLPNPPQAGENTGIDNRTLKQRRDDFVDYDKHLARRKELTHKVAMPYFREWSNMRFHKGKTFLAPSRIFKSDLSLYFPNLQGQTLLKDKKTKDTTPLFKDKVSVVQIFNTQWAENQTATFASEKNNPELYEAVRNSGDMAQMVQINFEENWMKAMLIKMFMPNLRRKLGVDNWGRYFLVRRGFVEQTREAIGYLNTKVGYIFVLDGDCKIRWAGSGPCEGDEKQSLVRAVERLVEDAKTKRAQKALVQKETKDDGPSLVIGGKTGVTTGE